MKLNITEIDVHLFVERVVIQIRNGDEVIITNSHKKIKGLYNRNKNK